MLKLFNATISDFSLAMREVSHMISLFIYTVMEVGCMGDLYFWEFEPKDGIRKNKSWEQQFGNKEVVK